MATTSMCQWKGSLDSIKWSKIVVRTILKTQNQGKHLTAYFSLLFVFHATYIVNSVCAYGGNTEKKQHN